jgi:hypothetical protein
MPLIEDPFLRVTYCSARRWDETFSMPIRDLGVGFISLVFRKALIEEVGLFDSVRFAGDAEFRERVKAWFSPYAIKDLKDELYKLRFRSDSLTSSGVGTILSLQENGKLGYRNSEARDLYKDNFMNWHKSGAPLYVSFPLLERPFPVGHPDQAIS